ncbi:hypothetical protein CHISP_0652 [Chitinispirillum alkaliphilum]|nr:hypothetical protein CHISP_0652 [Chitinispirillum alkaliphilum]
MTFKTTLHSLSFSQVDTKETDFFEDRGISEGSEYLAGVQIIIACRNFRICRILPFREKNTRCRGV